MREYIKLVSGLVGQDAPSSHGGLLTEYMESQTYLSILLEGARSAFLVKTYGEKLTAKYQSDTGVPGNVHAAIAREPGATLAEKLVEYFGTLDPTTRKNYAQWLVVRYIKNGFLLEDGERVTDALRDFDNVKNRLPKRDINSYPTANELIDAVAPLITKVEHFRQAVILPGDEERIAHRMRETDQTKVIYDGPDALVIHPLTIDSAAYWGRDTEWCTTWGHPWSRWPQRTSQYKSYTDRGLLYIVILKPSGAKFQFHPGSDSFMDANDRSIQIEDFLQARPSIREAFVAMDGKPFAKIGDYPVYLQGKGFIAKSRAGLMGKIMLNVVVDAKGHFDRMLGRMVNGGRGHGERQFDPGNPEVAAIMNRLAITGDPQEDSNNGLYYRDGTWGTVEEVAKPIYAGENGYQWEQVAIPVAQKRDLILTKGDAIIVHAFIEEHVFWIHYVNGGVRGNYHADISRMVSRFLLEDGDGAKKWDKGNGYGPSVILTREDAKALVTEKPYLGDIATAYMVHGASDDVKKMVVDYCEDNDWSHREKWIGDRLVAYEFDNIADMVEELGSEHTKRIFSVIEGDGGDYDYYPEHIGKNDYKDLVENLSKDNLAKLADYLVKKYPDEEQDRDFDPSNTDEVISLLADVRDDDFIRIVKQAVEAGRQSGAEAEMSKAFKKEIDSNPYIFFKTEEGYSGNLVWDTPAVFSVPMSDIIKLINDGAGLEYDGWMGHLRDGKLDAEAPYYGYNDFDDKAAQERFDEEIGELFAD